MITIVVPGQPQGKSRPRFGNGHAYTSDRTRAYETAIKWEGKQQWGSRPLLDGPLDVWVDAAFEIPKSWSAIKHTKAANGYIKPTGKPDLDNILKCLDALNGIVWKDDAQIVHVSITKLYSQIPLLRIQVAKA